MGGYNDTVMGGYNAPMKGYNAPIMGGTEVVKQVDDVMTNRAVRLSIACCFKRTLNERLFVTIMCLRRL